MRNCTNCGSSEIDEDPARGDATCMSCGTVLEESIVVTENQFQERAGGSGHTLVGQFVSAERAASNNFNGMGTQESREVTYQKGRKVIEEVASQLRINQHCIDTSFNFFKMCVSRNLTRGRARSAVVAVCLYITCRLENTAHLLLDFSDVTQINVFDLGRNFNFISRSLRITLPATDPCIYIIRFACMLDLGEKQKDVVNLATRLVQRMKRDWMSTGRRPTGICGAALLMAARSLNFNRSINDIVRIVHISESVIRKRLDEFSQTPSGSLTIDEFSTIDLEHYEDPPAFREARKRAREDQMRKEVEMATQMEEGLGEVQSVLETALDKKRREKFKTSPFAKLVAGSIDGVEARADDMIRNEVLKTVYDVTADEPSTSTSNTAHWAENYGPSLECLGIRKAEPIFHQEAAKSSEIIDEEISDSEIDGYILNAKEVQVKTEYWMKANGEIMKALEERKREREEHGDVKRKRKNPRKTDPTTGAPLTTFHAIEKVIHEKKLSNKINYDMLKDLEDFPSSVSKSAIEQNAVPAVVPELDSSKITNPLPKDFRESDLTKSERMTKQMNQRRGKGTKTTLDELANAFDLKRDDGEAKKVVEEKPVASRYSRVKPFLKTPIKSVVKPIIAEKATSREKVGESAEKVPEVVEESGNSTSTEKEPEAIESEKATSAEAEPEKDKNVEKASVEEIETQPEVPTEPEKDKIPDPKPAGPPVKSRYAKLKPKLAIGALKKAAPKEQPSTDTVGEPDAKQMKL